MQAVQQMERTVTLLPASPRLLQARTRQKQQKLRVAAYCRVSTDQDEQHSSYEAQVASFTEKISANPDWTLAGIFADEGITGTSTKKRHDFMRLMELCEQGKIDMILAKSISRFARNTVDCLNYIHMLKEQGVTVIFEKENINTMTEASELILTFLSAFAQAESESISKNVAWGRRQSFKNGKVTFQYNKMLGYEKGEDGKPKVVPEQAKTVILIYGLYLMGKCIAEIKRELERLGRRSPMGKATWSQQSIQSILSNEKYKGDALLQKTFTPDFLTGKSKKNNGEIPQYYVENNHPAIVSRELFDKVQEEHARRGSVRKATETADTDAGASRGKYSGKYILTGLVYCGDCGTQYRRTTWARNGKKKILWRCISRLKNGTRICGESPGIEEYRLHDAILSAINRLASGRDEIIGPLKECIRAALSSESDSFDAIAKQSRIAELDGIMADLLRLSVKSGAAADYFDAKFLELSGEKQALQEELAAYSEQQALSARAAARLDEISRLLDTVDLDLKVYDDAQVKRLVESIKVLSEEKILVTFKGGIEMEQEL